MKNNTKPKSIKLISSQVNNVIKPDYLPTYNTEKIIKNSPWIYWGVDNMFPSHLLEMFKNSPTHRSAVKSIHTFVLGEGFKKDYKGYTYEKGEDLFSIYKNIALDYILFKGFAIRVLPDGKLQHIDFSKIRIGRPNALGESETYFISSNWNSGTPKDIIEIPNYELGTSNQYGSLYYCKDYEPGLDFYPIPDYFAAKEAIIGEVEQQTYLKMMLTNSFSPKSLFKFKQEFTPEEENLLLYKLDQQFLGVANAGKPLIMTNMQSEDSITVEKMDTQVVDPSFSIINEVTVEKILSVHRLPRVLATLNSPSGFSNTGEEARMAFEIFNNKEIKHISLHLIDELKELTGITKLEVMPLELIKTQLSETTLLQILTTNEMREQYGYEALPEPKPDSTDTINNETNPTTNGL